jgi:hypothetical protein
MLNRSNGRRLVAALIASGAVGAGVPAAASASSLSLAGITQSTTRTVAQPVVHLADGTSCQEAYTDTTPFSPWSDTHSYRLVPGGDFPSGGSGWTLSGAASIGPSSSSYQLSGAGDAGELVLPAGSTAVSPYSCVDTAQPTVRFMDAGDSNAQLTVNAVFEVPSGLHVTLPLGVLTPGSGWQPSPTLVDGQAIAGLLSGGAAPMALSFASTGGTVDVSDAFVDPRRGS